MISEKSNPVLASAQNVHIKDALEKSKGDVVISEPYYLNPQVDGKQPSLADRIYHDEAKATAVTTSFITNIVRTEPQYLWRKFTVRECARLQGFPDSYEFPVSDSRAYKGIGNSWQRDVIDHVFGSFDFSEEPYDEF